MPATKVVKKGGGSEVGYLFWRFVFSAIGFLAIFWIFLKDLPQSNLIEILLKLWWVFVDSWVTGRIGAFFARVCSGYWKRERFSFYWLFKTLVISFCFALSIIFGILGMLAFNFGIFDWINFVILAIALKFLFLVIAVAIARSASHKLSTIVEG